MQKRWCRLSYVHVCLCVDAVVDGGWSRWSPWSRCDKRCGGGRSIRTRSCSSPPPKNGGKKCEGEKNQVKPCNTKPCGETDPTCSHTRLLSLDYCGPKESSSWATNECSLIQHMAVFLGKSLCSKSQHTLWSAFLVSHVMRRKSLQYHGKIHDLLFVYCQMRKGAHRARSSCCVPTSVHSAAQTSSRG